MIGRILARGSQRVLLDLREGGGIRGLHLAASLHHLISRGIAAEFWAIHGDADDVVLELELLRHSSDQPILRWNPGIAHVRFAHYVVMADTLPRGAIWDAARRRCGHTTAGLMFPDASMPSARNLTVLDGHDTRAFADSIETLLRRRSALRRMLGA